MIPEFFFGEFKTKDLIISAQKPKIGDGMRWASIVKWRNMAKIFLPKNWTYEFKFDIVIYK